MMEIIGYLTRWDVIESKFTLDMQSGTIYINLDDTLDSVLNEFIDAMKNRKKIKITIPD